MSDVTTTSELVTAAARGDEGAWDLPGAGGSLTRFWRRSSQPR